MEDYNGGTVSFNGFRGFYLLKISLVYGEVV